MFCSVVADDDKFTLDDAVFSVSVSIVDADELEKVVFTVIIVPSDVCVDVADDDKCTLDDAVFSVCIFYFRVVCIYLLCRIG